jgi:hypothetical protein
MNRSKKQKQDACQYFTQQRKSCHEIYGNKGEDCLNEELTEKRCLSLQYCPRQAKEYYGDAIVDMTKIVMQGRGGYEQQTAISPTIEESSATTRTTGTTTITPTTSIPSHKYDKGMCASWAEHFAYTDELRYGPDVVSHHRRAQHIVNNDKRLKLECRAIAFQLAQCLRSKNLFP